MAKLLRWNRKLKNLKASFKVKAGYVSQLQTAIAKRQIDFEELTIDVQDAAMVKTIEETLSSDDEIKQLFALEIIPVSNHSSINLGNNVTILYFDNILRTDFF